MVFLLAFCIPGLVIISVWLASQVSYPNVAICLPLLVGYIIFPAVQALWLGSRFKVNPVEVTAEKSAQPFWFIYYRVLPLLAVPAQFTMLAVAFAGFITVPFNLFGQIILIIVTGLFSAMFAITVAHELLHRRSRFDRFCAGLLLSSVSFGTFKIAHLKIHHPYVCTPKDFASARLNQSIYSFWRQSFVGNFYETLMCEKARLARNNKNLWRSELILWYGFSGLWLCIALYWGAWLGGLFFLLQSLFAIMYLDIINYLQHYGLQRQVESDGRPEPMQEHHSWAQGMLLDDLVLLNLPRHSQHHMQPQKPFQLLIDSDAAPRYPFNYGLMTFLVLVPPLFHRIAKQSLQRFETSRTGKTAS